MREIELRKHARCSICNNLIGSTGLPLFWTVKIERHGIKLDTIRRQDGLTALLGGNAELAQVMGTDEEMTQLLMGPTEITVCENCALRNELIAKAFEVSEDEEDNDEH